MNNAWLLLFVFLTYTPTVIAQQEHSSSKDLARSRLQQSTSSLTGIYALYDNRLKVLALPDKKLKVTLVAYWPKKGAPNEHIGTGEGIVELRENKGILHPVTDLGREGLENCQILLEFRKQKVIVKQHEVGRDCGFGINVTAEGTYKKISSHAPKFEE